MSSSVEFDERDEAGPSAIEILWRKLIARKMLIVSMTIFLGGVLAVTAQFLPPTYKATTSVIVESGGPRTINGLAPDQPFTDNTIGTELSLLESRELFEQTVDRLGLIKDPEFNKALKVSPIGQWKQQLRDEIRTLRGAKYDAADAQRYDTVESLRDQVKFAPIPLSRVINIVASSGNAQRASDIANTIAALYVEHREDITRRMGTHANDFLTARLKELKEAASAAAAAAEDYRVKNNLMLGGKVGGGKDTTLTQEEASNISEQLNLAQNRLATLQAAKASADAGNPEFLASVLASPTIAALRAVEANLEAKKAALLATYGPTSQVAAPVNNQLEGVRRTIHAESLRQVKSLDIDVKAATETVARLKAARQAGLANLQTNNVAQAHLDTLLTESQAAQSMYATFLARAKETDALRLFPDSNVRIVSNAVPPVYPSFPQNQIIMPASLGLGLLGSCGFVLLLDRRRLDGVSVDEAFFMSTLGLIPLRTANAFELYQDSIERLLSRLVRRNQRSQSIMITSALPQEGKTTISASLAEAASARGLRVVLLQADFRSVLQAGRLARPEIGLSDILRGEVETKDAMRIASTGEGQNLTVISSGPVPINPTRLLSLPAMEATLVDLKSRFDLIIIDAPPVLSGGDCWMIGHNVDFTILLVRAEETPRRDVDDAIAELGAKNDQLGIVLNMVDPRDMRRRG